MRNYAWKYGAHEGELEADSQYQAQCKAHKALELKLNKRIKSYKIIVMLTDVIHDPSILGA